MTYTLENGTKSGSGSLGSPILIESLPGFVTLVN